jgi:hypothetical protein
MHMHDISSWPNWLDPIDQPVTPTTWPDLVAIDPRLVAVELAIRTSCPPTDQVRFWRRWERWKKTIAELVDWDAVDERLRSCGALEKAVDHLFVVYDDRAAETDIQKTEDS